ncbi:MAG: tRNA1(Val) (adenine(37)-N6)-methyltransferase [Nitrospiraceae bacterium]|nr:tRNA1(Val) (adenine(37)-N6)-methyltransferase [Nitrospiraceae bacterium]
MTLTLDSIRDIRLYQRRRGYRFSLDALLLFDFARLQKAGNIADLGAGSGVVGLLLAKKYPAAKVTLVELQEGLYGLALKNIALNGLADRVRAVKADLRAIGGHLTDWQSGGHEGPSPDFGQLGRGSLDMIVSNPPFRKVMAGRISLDEERAAARHELTLPLAALVKAAAYLVKNRGRFFMIYHPERLPEMFGALADGGFEPKRLRFVHGRPGPPAGGLAGGPTGGPAGAKIVLVESVKGGSPGLSVERPLFVYAPDGSYSPEVRGIYGL